MNCTALARCDGGLIITPTALDPVGQADGDRKADKTPQHAGLLPG